MMDQKDGFRACSSWAKRVNLSSRIRFIRSARVPLWLGMSDRSRRFANTSAASARVVEVAADMRTFSSVLHFLISSFASSTALYRSPDARRYATTAIKASPMHVIPLNAAHSACKNTA